MRGANQVDGISCKQFSWMTSRKTHTITHCTPRVRRASKHFCGASLACEFFDVLGSVGVPDGIEPLESLQNHVP
jgi:hypothetical protein